MGTIIETATSGTNGAINITYLTGKLEVDFFGMLVRNSGGIKHHLKGIIPDVSLEQSRKSVTERQDL